IGFAVSVTAEIAAAEGGGSTGAGGGAAGVDTPTSFTATTNSFSLVEGSTRNWPATGGSAGSGFSFWLTSKPRDGRPWAFGSVGFFAAAGSTRSGSANSGGVSSFTSTNSHSP